MSIEELAFCVLMLGNDCVLATVVARSTADSEQDRRITFPGKQMVRPQIRLQIFGRSAQGMYPGRSQTQRPIPFRTS